MNVSKRKSFTVGVGWMSRSRVVAPNRGQSATDLGGSMYDELTIHERAYPRGVHGGGSAATPAVEIRERLVNMGYKFGIGW